MSTYVDVLNPVHGLHSFPYVASALKRKLNSAITIVDMDIDGNFSPEQALTPVRCALGPAAKYGLACFSGVLYHLRSPLITLENIAQTCEYCIFSTRSFSYLPDNKTYVGDKPLIYVLEPGELGGDPTNYFVFTPETIRRLLSRSGWKIIAMEQLFVRPDKLSNPVSLDYFERTLAILKSDH